MNEKPHQTWEEAIRSMCQESEKSSVSLTPPGLANTALELSDQDKLLAWEIYTQLRTRIATQPLPIRQGVESGALKSIFELFNISRVAMVLRPDAKQVASLIVHCLNSHIRPFTAFWHARMDTGGFESLDQRFLFRAQLHKLQELLRVFTGLLGQIAGDECARQYCTPVGASEPSSDATKGFLRFGIRDLGDLGKLGEVVGSTTLEKLNAEEERIINLRRNASGRHTPTSQAQTGEYSPVFDGIGLAISGGGIRSATFALGVTEVLAKKGILQDIDVISTVSGGSYLGCFISSVLNDKAPNIGLHPHQEPFAGGASIETKTIRQLRNHSKYLTEGGMSTFFQIAFSAIYGVTMSMMLIAPVIFISAIATLFSIKISTYEGWGALSQGIVLKAAWTGFALLVIALSVLRGSSKKSRASIERAAMSALIVAIALHIFEWLPTLFQLTKGNGTYLLMAMFLWPTSLATFSIWHGVENRQGFTAWLLYVLFGPIFFLTAWLITIDFLEYLRQASPLLPAVVTTLVCAYGWFGININFASLHLYYRNRLANTYMRRVGASQPLDPQRLSEMNQFHKAPLHLINAAINLPGSRNVELRGRNTDFFIFAQHYCGGPTVGFWPTTDWEKEDKHLDLGTAMAISGAAAAPRMGTLTSPRYTALLAVLNVRLGYWLKKPEPCRRWDRVPGGLYFAREITGKIDEELPFVNVSDGGHIDNMGLYELLRRRCRYIILIDGEADPKHSFAGLLSSLQMAKIDLGVDVDPDLSDLRVGIDPFKRAHFTMAKINYKEVGNDTAVQGLLLVIKLALTGNEPEQLMRYRDINPTFPHQSTAQQVFNEAQFEAYRSLGEHAATAAFDPLIAGSSPLSARNWLLELEKRLLPQS